MGTLSQWTSVCLVAVVYSALQVALGSRWFHWSEGPLAIASGACTLCFVRCAGWNRRRNAISIPVVDIPRCSGDSIDRRLNGRWDLHSSLPPN
jgi:hypothetical protein